MKWLWLSLLLAACGEQEVERQLVGRWQEAASGASTEFSADGAWRLLRPAQSAQGPEKLEGRWRITDDQRLEMSFTLEGYARATTTAWRFQDRNHLELVYDDGSRATLTRITPAPQAD